MAMNAGNMIWVLLYTGLALIVAAAAYLEFQPSNATEVHPGRRTIIAIAAYGAAVAALWLWQR